MIWKSKKLNNKKDPELSTTYPLSDIISHITVSKSNNDDEVNKIIKLCKQSTVSQREWENQKK